MTFQSSPSGEAGCYAVTGTRHWLPTWFQSSPSGEAGCYLLIVVHISGRILFQSSPSGEAGCYGEIFLPTDFMEHVSILTQR